jgi:Rieske Fe-S protein
MKTQGLHLADSSSPVPKTDAKVTGSSRRQFVRTFAFGSISVMAGPPWVATLVATLFGENNASAADGQLNLQLSNFPALQQTMGSVRVTVNPISGSYPTGNFYPVVITRGNGNTFYAVSSQCPHRACVTGAYDSGAGAIVCPCHGSMFDVDGTYISGPAQTSLTRLAINFDGVNTIRVTVPGLGYSITTYALISGTSPRIRLDFSTFPQVQYEVRFRQNATDAWSVVLFATTSSGAANNSYLTGDGTNKSVYVNRTTPAGFYSVAIRVIEV